MDMHSAERRSNPRIFDTDYLLMRGLRTCIEKVAGLIAKRSLVAIDFGCGSQPYRALFEERGVYYRGADFANADLLIDASGRVGVSAAQADIVLSFQVLEHVRDVPGYLSEARRILKDDGWLLLSTHGSWLYHPHPEDHRRWTRQGLNNELETAGFEVTDCTSLVGPLATTTMIRLTGFSFVSRRIPVVGSFIVQMLSTIMNIRGLLEDLITPEWIKRDNACVYVMLARKSGRLP
jgi:SAM-dependent methyltransferase